MTEEVQKIEGKVTLVGHSMGTFIGWFIERVGGTIISGVAERIPHKIERLVYLTAFLLPPGISVADIMVRKDQDLFDRPERCRLHGKKGNDSIGEQRMDSH